MMLVDHILTLENMLIGLNRRDLMSLAFQLAEANNIKHCFNSAKKAASKHWYNDFMKRHPTLSLRQPEPTSIARAKGFNRKSVYEFYDKLENIVTQYSLKAYQIFNMDESAITTVQKPGKVISAKGKKQVGALTSGEKGVTTTVVCAMSASGVYVPPMIIFKRKRMIDALGHGAPSGSLVTNNESGWMTKELFSDWLKHFVAYVGCSKDKPVLVILDGHVSHTKNYDAIEYARANGVHILSLPPHTTHRLQPLDRAYFKSLKLYYNEECDRWIRLHSTVITIFKF